MENKNKLLLVGVIVIFLIFASYNIANYIIMQKYNKVNDLSLQIEQIKNKFPTNSTEYKEMEEIEEEIKFISNHCFKDIGVYDDISN